MKENAFTDCKYLTERIRVVVVEDRSFDAELIISELEQVGLNLVWNRVQTEEDFIEAIKTLPDLILSDYSLPQFSGLRALTLLREQGLDIPFILISGALGEEAAVDAIRQGANDYLLKDRLGRLPHAVLRALEEKRMRDERKRAEESLRASEERFRCFFEQAAVGVAHVTLDGRFALVNQRYADITGRTREELQASTFQELTHPDDLQNDLYYRDEILAGRIQTYTTQKRYLHRDGISIWVDVAISMVRDSAGNPQHFIAVVEDITKHKQAEEAVRRAEAQFRGIFENAVEGILQTTPEGRIVTANPAFARILGYESAEALLNASLSMGSDVYVNPKDRVEFLRAMRDPNLGKNLECQLKRKDGKLIWVSFNARAVKGASGTIQCYDANCVDITERKRAEERQAVEQSVVAILAEGRPLAETVKNILKLICLKLNWDVGVMWTPGRGGKELRCMELWTPPSTEFFEFAKATRQAKLSDTSSLPGWVWDKRVPRWIADRSENYATAKSGIASNAGLNSGFAFPVRLRDEVLGVIEFLGAIIREPDAELLAMFNSVGSQIGQYMDRWNLEQQLRESQKMDAIGTLAGGIAHDFNNILAAISGYTELAKMDCADNPGVSASLSHVLAANRRAADLVRQILAFSRRQEQKREPTQLRNVIEEALKLLRATIPATIEFQISLGAGTPAVLADASQIHQVIMNLCTNAWHAMKDRPGCLKVALEKVQFDRAQTGAHQGLVAGQYACLTVSDTGKGMDKGTLERIFDPFFTTKGPGEGTGLGLSVVHGIIKSHDGVITVSSQPGKGTTFELYFPAYTSEISVATRGPATIPRGNGERILVVDDEEPLLDLEKQMLERLGYQVEAQASVAMALARVRDGFPRLDLVITDLTMPQMTGLEFSRNLMQICPGLPIILTTGFSAGLTSENVAEMGIAELLLKPLSLDNLSTAVHRALTKSKTTET
jgi:PAS domain S-box-containing protein